MRVKSAASKVARAVPPPELRQFTDPSRPGWKGAGLGASAYPDRDAWLAARRKWADANGLTVLEWFDAMLAETQEAGCTLAELNAAFSGYLIEADDDYDPRLR